MQRSSDSIGAIAAALARAQLELTNPEKSLTGTISSESPREDGKQFRYAPLSSGLEIIRKCLGKHEIAAVQTTAIDKEASLIRLTTMLAHASGEWIASEWPVCPVTETAMPHQLGAALTYARRHALFTLVGIAGEDDTDAQSIQTNSLLASSDKLRAQLKARLPSSRSLSRPSSGLAIPRLPEQQSVARRDELLAELGDLSTAQELTAWARRSMPDKNALLESDLHAIEKAFTKKAAVLTTSALEGPPIDPAVEFPSDEQAERVNTDQSRRKRAARAANQTIDKSVLAFPEPKRLRDKEHLKFVATQPCLVCGRAPSDAHHIRFAQLRALGRKVSDEFTVPLCRGHHRQAHRTGNEPAFWESLRIDPMEVAKRLWQQSRGLLPSTESEALIQEGR